MEHRNPTFEATLLYNSIKVDQFSHTIDAAKACLDTFGEGIESVEKIDNVFTFIHCRSIKVLLAHGTEPLPLGGFQEAQGPATSNLRDAKILACLTQICATTTILVLENHAAEAKGPRILSTAMRELCWSLTEEIFTCSDAGLVFWSETETLYAPDEFRQAVAIAKLKQSVTPPLNTAMIPPQVQFELQATL